MTNVYLHGELGRRFGKKWRLDVSSVGEAIRAIEANVGGIYAYFYDKKDALFRVLQNSRDLEREEDTVLNHGKGIKTLHIIPALAGASKGGGVFMLIAGAVLLGAAIIMTLGSAAPIAGPLAAGQTTLGHAGFFATLAASKGLTLMATLGLGMVFSGVMSLTQPSIRTETNERPENKPSYLFNGGVNTYRQGNPVPVGYGELQIGSQTISVAISNQDLALQ